MANLRFILTGGPGAGKTTVLELLSEMGFDTASDSARKIIRNRLDEGLSPRPEPRAFAEAVLNDDINNYDNLTPSGKPVFFDRGVCDALGSLAPYLPAATIESYMNEYPYNKTVFIFPPWKEIYRTDSERDHTFDHALKVHQQLLSWYSRHGYKLIEVQPDEASERAQYILDLVDTLTA